MSGRRRVAAALATAAVLAAAAALAVPAWQARALRQAGAALFDGRTALAARIQGHDDNLPAQAARCANCHTAGAGAPATPGSGPVRSATPGFGPVLSADTLAQPLPRRGGTPSRYDTAALCRLLREGIDPAFVTLARAMPRYQVSDAQCAALWAHLAS